MGVQQVENSRVVNGIKGFLKVGKYEGELLTQLLGMVNAIVCRKHQVFQPVLRLEASLGLFLEVVCFSVVGKDEVDAGHI